MRVLDLLIIPKSMLPQVRILCIYGERTRIIFGQSIPIAGVAGDQQAALWTDLFGWEKSTLWLGCFLLMNTGEKPVKSIGW